MAKITKEEALNYHSEGRPGKIQVVPTTAYSTQRDLSLAYSPGVAEPCLEIEKNPNDSYKYTARQNLVAVISNGTAVLGLGNLGALAGKPVMEGKGLLFKIFADIDVFDIELDTEDIDKFVETVKIMAPTFGGINLEDIKAPECFEIEAQLKKALDIPVMHDDQHGTAIISAAGVVNALKIVKKKIENIKIVVSGAGASAIACTNLLISIGAKKKNIVMCDSKGVINDKRTDLSKYKKQFATSRKLSTLEDAIKDADLFLGLSVKDLLSKKMVKTMADNPIIFAMANPDPEISYEDALDARSDVIMATGRSDYPNQVNNVLGFPFIFRGALDVRASDINEEMKIAAVYALADLANEDVPEEVNTAYNNKQLVFGREYLIPKPLDPRLITKVAPAVAQAAMDSGVARVKITDMEAYKEELIEKMGHENKLIREIYAQARKNTKKVVYADADNYTVLKAAQLAHHEGFSEPILVGDKKTIENLIDEFKLDELKEVAVICDPYAPEMAERRERYTKYFYEHRHRKGVSPNDVKELMYNRNYFGTMLVESGEADVFITGYATKYRNALRPIIEVINCNDKIEHVAGMHIISTKRGTFFFADTSTNITHDVNSLVQTVLTISKTIRKMNIEPKIAMVSYSNFGTVRSGMANTVAEAVEILHRKHPDLAVDGEMQMNFALNPALRMKKFPFSKLQKEKINTIVFPDLDSANAAYKMMQEIGNAEVFGPILNGVKRPIHIVPLEASVKEIVHMTAIGVVDAQNPSKGFTV
jgi:malate dehydrogenase (oxaloacetate-decarboxylating)(NADP+)